VGVLVLLSLVLITISFREPSTGALHQVESAGATVLRPFEVGAERIARPFRDVYGYFRGLVHAKRENERLKDELNQARQQALQNESARQENAQLQALLDFQDSPSFPADFRGVSTRILTWGNEFDQQVVIAAGSNQGIHEDTPVVTGDGLVGRVTAVFGSLAQVTLLTDEDSAVSAIDQKTRAVGVVRHGQGRNSLVLDLVTKDKNVRRGDVIVTAGRRSPQFPSLFPRGIQIGTVTSVGQSETSLFKQIQIEPFVDFSSVDAVIALVAQGRKP